MNERALKRAQLNFRRASCNRNPNRNVTRAGSSLKSDQFLDTDPRSASL